MIKLKLTTLAVTIAFVIVPLTGMSAPRSSTGIAEGGMQALKLTPLPGWIETPAAVPHTLRKEPVLIRLAETQVQLGKETRQFFNRAIQVNERSMLSRIGQFGIDYIPEYQKLFVHRVAVIRDGVVHDRSKDVNMRRLQRETGMEAGTYIGAETVQLLLSDVRVGDTLWISYSIEGSNPVFGAQWSGTYSWDGTEPLELRRLLVSHPLSRPLAWRQLGDFPRPAIAMKQDERNGMRYLRFEGQALEPVAMEPGIPSDYLPVRALEFSEHADWGSVARWAHTLFPKVAPGTGMNALVKQFASLPSLAERAAAALHWVQREVRYFSVSMGENSHRPRPPEAVLKQRYGDCKDKSYLLVSLLGAMGIEAYPVLVSSEARRLPTKTLPEAGWFDHVVVAIRLDGATYYVDPTRTGQTAQLAQLPPVLPGAAALPVRPGSDTLVQLPPLEQSGPLYEHVEQFNVADFQSDAVLELHRIYRGRFAEWMRDRYAGQSEAEQQKDLLTLYEKLYDGVTLAGKPVVNDDAGKNSFEVVARYALPKAVVYKDKKYSLRYESQIVAGSLPIPDKLVRNFPFALSSGDQWTRYRATVQWPRQVRSAGSAGVTILDNPYFEATEEHVLRGNRMDLLVDYRIKSETIQPSDMAALHAEARKLESFHAGSLVIGESAVREEKTLALPFRMVQASEIGLSAKTRFAAQSYKDKPVSSEFDCDTLMAGMTVPEVQQFSAWPAYEELKARVDGKRAGTEELRCYARTLFGQGEHALAQGVLAGLPAPAATSELMRTAAWAKFYAGDGAAAIMAFNTYADAVADLHGGALRRMVDIERMALYQRAGIEVPAGLQRLARAIPEGPWPRPILAMQAGILTPEQLLQAADVLGGDAAAIARQEAWYFIGHKLAADGDTAAALRAFKKSGALEMHRDLLVWDIAAAIAHLRVPDPDHAAGRKSAAAKEMVRAAEQWNKGAAAGRPASQRQLGLAYLRGDGLPKNNDLAAKWLLAAAEQGDEAAQYSYSQYLSGTKADTEGEALRWLQAAAGQGYAPALYQLSIQLLQASPPDTEAAVRALQSAAEQGDDNAQTDLGYYFMSGLHVGRDDNASVFWSALATSQGNSVAANNLGVMFEKGRAVKQDPIRAFELYKFAAEKGHSSAQASLGWMYTEGVGVERDYSEAVKWLRKSADGKNRHAQRMLGYAYDVGHGVKQNQDEAHRLYLLAAEQGDDSAQFNAGYNYEFGEGVKQDYVRAADWYRKAALQENRNAAYSLGRLYRDGKGVPQDRAEALKWYRKAAENGHKAAKTAIASYEQNGDLVD